MATTWQAVRAFGVFHTLSELLDRTGMARLLELPTPFTLLAPMDDAFEAIAHPDFDAWVAGHNHETMIALLARHMLPGRLRAADLVGSGLARTHHGEALGVVGGDRWSVGGARVLQADVRCDNGILHVIDRVLVATAPLPGQPSPGPESPGPSGPGPTRRAP